MADWITDGYMQASKQKLSRKQVAAIRKLDDLNCRIRSRASDPTIDAIIEALTAIVEAGKAPHLVRSARMALEAANKWRAATDPMEAGFNAWCVADFLFGIIQTAMTPAWDREFWAKSHRKSGNRANRTKHCRELQIAVDAAYVYDPHVKFHSDLCRIAAKQLGANPHTGKRYDPKLIQSKTKNPIKKTR